MEKGLHSVVQAQFSKHVLVSHAYRGQETLLMKREGLLEVARFLKDGPSTACDVLMDLSCLDYLKFGKVLSSSPTLATPSPLPYYMEPKAIAEVWERGVSNDEYRFEVVYHLYSTAKNHRLRLKVPVSAADPTVDSLTGVWRSADWFEREVWDMFGIRFEGHPDLRRILLPDDWEGYPLLKSYAVDTPHPPYR